MVQSLLWSLIYLDCQEVYELSTYNAIDLNVPKYIHTMETVCINVNLDLNSVTISLFGVSYGFCSAFWFCSL